MSARQVECAPDGYKSAAAACGKKPQVEGFPTWEIGGKFYGGYQSLEELASLSGFQAPKPLAEAKADDLSLDLSTAAPVVRSGEDCDLATGAAGCT